MALAVVCLASSVLGFAAVAIYRRRLASQEATPGERYGLILLGAVFAVTLVWAGNTTAADVVIRAVFRFELWASFITFNLSSILAILEAREARGENAT